MRLGSADRQGCSEPVCFVIPKWEMYDVTAVTLVPADYMGCDLNGNLLIYSKYNSRVD